VGGDGGGGVNLIKTVYAEKKWKRNGKKMVLFTHPHQFKDLKCQWRSWHDVRESPSRKANQRRPDSNPRGVSLS
jgi:hypothetical protein